uniref:L1 transposable element RRM domain-containing protein n=1 Tax=Latimeria chalumnae TaxID=7897 RepID=H2ZYA4_LATCH
MQRTMPLGKKPMKKLTPVSPESGTSEETAGSTSSSPVGNAALSLQESMAVDIKNIHALLLQLTSNVSEVKLAIQSLQDSQDKLGAHIVEAENRISKIEDNEMGVKKKVKKMEQQLSTALDRIEDLENRSRRNNLRILGFPKGVEEGNPVKFLQEALPDLLDLDAGQSLEIERAHQTLGPRPVPEQHPRAFIVKFLRYPTRDLLLLAAKNLSQLKWRDHRIFIFPDWSRELQLKRQWFWEVRRTLREKNIKYGLFYPAILKITRNGETRSFTDLMEAKKYLAQE